MLTQIHLWSPQLRGRFFPKLEVFSIYPERFCDSSNWETFDIYWASIKIFWKTCKFKYRPVQSPDAIYGLKVRMSNFNRSPLHFIERQPTQVKAARYCKICSITW